jgi:hypothetical protein
MRTRIASFRVASDRIVCGLPFLPKAAHLSFNSCFAMLAVEGFLTFLPLAAADGRWKPLVLVEIFPSSI